jgi:two-component system response regulator RegA
MNAENKEKRLLIVEDDEIYRERMGKALEKRNFSVQTAPDVITAISLCQKDLPDYALVDIRMPGEDGLTFVKQLREQSEEVRIVVLTGFGSIVNALEAVRKGADDYLTKPADITQILAALNGDNMNKSSSNSDTNPPTLDEVEWEHIHRILTEQNNNISETARILGIDRRTLQRKLSKFAPHPAPPPYCP